MQTTLFIASKVAIRPLKRAWVNLGQNLGGIGVTLGQNWGGNRHRTHGGKVGVKWGWKIDPCPLDESWIKLGWNRGKVGVKSGRISPDKRRIKSVQSASVWHRGRDGYIWPLSLEKGLYNRRPKGDQKLQWFCSEPAVELQLLYPLQIANDV